LSDDTNSQALSSVAAKGWIAALRPAHWVKNLLLAAPLVFAQADLSVAVAARIALAMLLMCAAASAGYIVNDLVDRKSDRKHASKRYRPIADGRIGERQAMVVAALLGGGAVLLAILSFGSHIALLLVGYLSASFAYTVLFKRLPYVDVLLLAWLYIWRFVVGGAVAGIALSSWLMAFGYCLFVSLALAKRLDELASTDADGSTKLDGRAYRGRHSQHLLVLCTGLAVASIAVLAVYVGYSEAASYYHARGWLWLAAALLAIWLARIISYAAAGRLKGDPVLFAVSDSLSLILAIGVAAALVAAA
jgi:4-hydroxybenzoate polyprenyltransferase